MTITTTPTNTAPRHTTKIYCRERASRAHGGNRNHNQIHIMYPILAELTGNIASAFGLLGAAIGVGLIGQKAAEAVGRNPGASGKILVQAIIGMALAEGLGILALFLA